MKISLIICTKDRPESLRSVLECATRQTLEQTNYEILVIDQSLSDDSQTVCKDYGNIKYEKLNSTGVSISRNKGIELASGKILVYVDDDVEFEEDYLPNILNFFETSPLKPDMIGGKTYIRFVPEKPEWIGTLLKNYLAYSDFGDTAKPYDNHPKHVPYTCNMAVKKECAEAIGGFSVYISKMDSKIAVNDDVMFALEGRKLGYNLIYNPDMFIWHIMPQKRLTYEYFKKKFFSHGKSDALMYYELGMLNKYEIPQKIMLHFSRIIESIFPRYFTKNIEDKYYQKLRLYYNSGYIKALFSILTAR